MKQNLYIEKRRNIRMNKALVLAALSVFIISSSLVAAVTYEGLYEEGPKLSQASDLIGAAQEQMGRIPTPSASRFPKRTRLCPEPSKSKGLLTETSGQPTPAKTAASLSRTKTATPENAQKFSCARGT